MLNRYKNTWNAILQMILGRKYYVNIINTRGAERYEASCFIFASRAAAKRHADKLATNRSYAYIETISFRSRYIYPAQH